MDALEALNKTHRQIFCYNENIGHLFVPNINARVIHETGGYYVRTNSLGFRSDVEFKEKKNGKGTLKRHEVSFLRKLRDFTFIRLYWIFSRYFDFFDA
tara:strand:- start:1140 stop:1433 length:294 start_codon:yes stop_codon:yes gene_type:complete